jgi:hypothetical protein
MWLQHDEASPNFSREVKKFRKKIMKEDGLEGMDRWLGSLGHPTSTHYISFSGVA